MATIEPSMSMKRTMPIHVSLTGRIDQKVGWNVYARQPLPTIGGMRMVSEMIRPQVVGYVDLGYGSEGFAAFGGLDYPF